MYQHVRGPQESSSKEACLMVLGPGELCSVSSIAPETRGTLSFSSFFFNEASISHILFDQRIISSINIYLTTCISVFSGTVNLVI